MPPAPPDPHPLRRPDRRRLLIFALLSLGVVAATIGYALYSRARAPRAASSAAPPPGVADPRVLDLRREPHILFRSTALGAAYGRVMIVPRDRPDAERVATSLACDRVHASSGSGMCLQASRGVLTTYQAIGFDRELRQTARYPLAGAPSRTRVSRDGRYGASTVFVSGDSYNAGSFSTRTTIFDLASGRALGDLESFVVEKDGQPFKQADFNFWGVTFGADSNRFYATLGTGGALYLVEGRVAERTVRVIRDGVECPSLSPDGTRLAYKSRATDNGRRIWHVRVVSLATGATTELADARSIDDQVEWLDDARILYSLPSDTTGGSSDVWVAAADGSGTAQIFLKDATSPSVVR